VTVTTLGDALRLLGLPLDSTIDEQMLVGAYRDAAREHHPDAAPEDEREAQTERMLAINLARDVVRTHLERLGAEPFASFQPVGDGPGPGLFWDVTADDLASLGIRWNPNATRIPWATRVDAARRATFVVSGDQVTVDENGTLREGRVTAFDEGTRVGLRTSLHGIPVEVRRVGMEVEFADGERRTVDAADVTASGWRCPVCLRTSPRGLPQTRPCPRCLRRFRDSYPRWREQAATIARLRRRLERLNREPADFTPRRFPRYRELEQTLADLRARADSLRETRAALTAALDQAQADEQLATVRAGRARTEEGAKRRRRETARHAAEAERARAAIAGLDADLDANAERAAALGTERDELERTLRLRHEASVQAREASAERRERERRDAERDLRRAELELAALNPDAPALVDAFEAWGQSSERWLS
jgi:hypothetical protein